MWGEIITAGATLVGGLFGGKEKKQTSSVNYVQMARNAEKAGFNPLTALRNGGSAGFTSTVSHPGLSGLGDAIAQVGGQIGAAVSQKFDPIEQKRSQVESSLLDYQLQQIQSGALQVPRFGDVPAAAGSANATQRTPPLNKSVGGAKPPRTIVAGDAPTASEIGLYDRFGITIDPGTPDAAVFEQRYGEPGDWIGGVYVGGMDLYHNVKNKSAEVWKDAQAPMEADSVLRKGAQWIDKTLGLQKPVKGGRVAPTTSW